MRGLSNPHEAEGESLDVSRNELFFRNNAWRDISNPFFPYSIFVVRPSVRIFRLVIASLSIE